MGPGLLVALAALVLAVLLCVACTLLLGSRRSNRRLSQELSGLRGRLEQLEEAASERPTGREDVLPTSRADEAEYLITTAGLPALREPSGQVEPRPQIDARQFASLAVGESLVRIASLAYGVRRALSAENRNRIGFEVRREIRRARRDRKRELKEVRRHLRTTRREEDAA